ncbi:MAG: DUF192 domain-containing protein [Pseudomonadota bacterium]
MRSVIALLVLLFASPTFAFECAADKLRLEWQGGSVEFTVDVADDAEERAQGLMFVDSMPRFSGMLFVYPEPQNFIAFWMRNTLIPLDMLFFDERGVLKKIHENAVPLDETSIPGGQYIQYVLEINGGMSERLRIQDGAVLVSSAIDQTRAFRPCQKPE